MSNKGNIRSEIREARGYVKTGNLKSALNVLSKIVEIISEWNIDQDQLQRKYDSIIATQSRLSDLERYSNQDTEPFENRNITRNRIRQSILSLINEIETEFEPYRLIKIKVDSKKPPDRELLLTDLVKFLKTRFNRNIEPRISSYNDTTKEYLFIEMSSKDYVDLLRTHDNSELDDFKVLEIDGRKKDKKKKLPVYFVLFWIVLAISLGFFGFYFKNYLFGLPNENIVNSSDFEVLKRKVLVDLSLRKKVAEEHKNTLKLSPVIWGNEMRVIRRNRSQECFIKHLWTSGLLPEVASTTHNIRYFRQVKYESPRGRTDYDKYEVCFDVSNELPGEPFDLNFQYVTWNAFQDDAKNDAALPTLYPTNSVEFTIIAPRNKPFKNPRLSYYLTDGVSRTTTEIIDSTGLYFTGDSIVWQYEDPKLNNTFRVGWFW